MEPTHYDGNTEEKTPDLLTNEFFDITKDQK